MHNSERMASIRYFKELKGFMKFLGRSPEAMFKLLE